MTDLTRLPAATGLTTPPFEDARSAKAWLQLLPLINAPVVHAEFVEAFEALLDSAIAPYETLKILELMREPVHLTQSTLIDRIVGRALPLAPDEEKTWRGVGQLWGLLGRVYARCWRAALEGDEGTAEHKALLAQRSLRYLSLQARESLLVFQPIPTPLWEDLFGYYQLAETHQLSEKPAKDSLMTLSGVATPQQVFIQVLLLSAASPFHFTGRQILWLDERLPMLAQRAPLSELAPSLPGRGSLQVDLAEPGPPRRVEPRLSGPTIRELDTFQLAQALSRRIKLLRQGENPEKLGLGTQFAGSVIEGLLVDVYRTWCEHPSERSVRHRTDRSIEVVFGLTKQAALIGGSEFGPPDDGPSSLKEEDAVRFALFGQRSPAGVKPKVDAPVREPWHVRNESAQGLRLARRATDGTRIALQQLIVVDLDGKFFAAVVRWLQQEDHEGEPWLSIGVRLLPGQPAAAMLRPVELAHSDRRGWNEGMSLPPVTSLKAPQSLLVPVGWFRRGRLVEWWDGEQIRKVRVETLLERGVDYERVHVVPAGQAR
ncbi:hypothetical protein SAMN02745857_00546 [Andreprevotia lacus DSM 23236]|jgi:hypothetical protein|uniref:Molecular chaperone n=1 Tax=Andreprevotia lacus DSM 23236 TaxID=1121001 RepID=A0A1W1X3R6_9NEIS|nr:hypothetical protein [Andreprevotia lacus]SMC18368.1 hypothetical protein SAMN02745857_00546 [Andreprevotia lacus DSM 23236]